MGRKAGSSDRTKGRRPFFTTSAEEDSAYVQALVLLAFMPAALIWRERSTSEPPAPLPSPPRGMPAARSSREQRGDGHLHRQYRGH